MDKLDRYRAAIQQLIEEYGNVKPAYGEVEMQKIFDTQRDHYQLMAVGWDGLERVRGIIFQIDIKHEKVWIQHNGSDVNIAEELVSLGVPKDDIVLAFHPVYKRPYTGFAVN